ncbi:MAG: toxin-antitoxin system YwqK family antitoxin [Flavobacteriales bacterium]|jgi:antitoxin component YwqK of YwqJK toxin-antitoxin module|nr:toxin-antitoxin system YwqK family antitoxin [Flavobacteriales bacterium]MBK6550111.1 toxin-antitoxin system YwqK family antitoxin [Flavobacteriales bacterium]MBK6881728.1 toxin-antitoxin system YwqK family antitoxin [Flavobacteriales bacterium]MBK7102621.1 toxin-antitoxin system YwqK family antitoxin [Flavobacteriales bacterium]MBK7113355.1 toxin-antitoxin system YwqK family antitoxin [Flavobacteriales bacterium]
MISTLRSRFLPFLVLFLLVAQVSFAQAGAIVQDTLNRVDEMGRKQGLWKVTAPVAEKPGYENGQLVEEGRYTNSKRIGVWRRYWPNGKVMSEITYQMGRPRGEYKTFYPNGKTEELGSWDLDRNTGKFQRWHANGQLAQDFVFNEHGVRDGEQKYYHENGTLAVQVSVNEGKEEGTLKRYTPDGQLQQVAQFDNGVIDAANSKYIKPVPKADEVKPDPKAAPAPAVTAEETTNAITFRDNGYNTLYDRQLRLSQQGEFLNGRLHDGKRYTYDKDGILVRIQQYKSGRYIGDAVITDEDLR